jgi:hypothetical protein
MPPGRTEMKLTKVGTYYFCWGNMDIFLRRGGGAEFCFNTSPTSLPRMVIGADDTWTGVLDSLLHESLESTLATLKLRYRCNEDSVHDNSKYTFMFNHGDLADVSYRVAELLEQSMDDLKKAWIKYKKD